MWADRDLWNEICDNMNAGGTNEGLSSVVVFLGIEVDTMAMQLRLPSDKMTSLKKLLGKWQGKKECRKRPEVPHRSAFTCMQSRVKQGRTFLRRLIDMSKIENPAILFASTDG